MASVDLMNKHVCTVCIHVVGYDDPVSVKVFYDLRCLRAWSGTCIEYLHSWLYIEYQRRKHANQLLPSDQSSSSSILQELMKILYIL